MPSRASDQANVHQHQVGSLSLATRTASSAETAIATTFVTQALKQSLGIERNEEFRPRQ
jgi:hypothetical protein